CLAGPAVAHHELRQRRPPVWAILTVGPAEWDDGGALDMIGDAEDFMDTSLATAGEGGEHGTEAEGSRRQREILHTWVNRGTGLKSGLAGGWRVDAGDDQHRCGRERLTHLAGSPWPVPASVGPRFLVYVADRLLHSLVADHNEVPGLGVGAGG